MKKPEYIIALIVIACSVALALLFSYAIGAFNYADDMRNVKVRFTEVEGLNLNSQVKYAGAPVGRVIAINVISKKEREQLTPEFKGAAIEVTAHVLPDLFLPEDLSVSMKQEGMLGPKYIAISPGDNPDATAIDPKKIIMGNDPVGLEQLYASGERLINKIVPMTQRLEQIAVKVDDALPGIVVGLDTLLDDGDQLISSINSSLITPENEQRLKKIMDDMNVMMQNMKVVSSNAKALTMTLAQTPWRLVWGGPTNPPVPEQDVLRSNQPLPIDNVIQVNRPREAGAPAPARSTPQVSEEERSRMNSSSKNRR